MDVTKTISALKLPTVATKVFANQMYTVIYTHLSSSGLMYVQLSNEENKKFIQQLQDLDENEDLFRMKPVDLVEQGLYILREGGCNETFQRVKIMYLDTQFKQAVFYYLDTGKTKSVELNYLNTVFEIRNQSIIKFDPMALMIKPDFAEILPFGNYESFKTDLETFIKSADKLLMWVKYFEVTEQQYIPVCGMSICFDENEEVFTLKQAAIRVQHMLNHRNSTTENN